MMGDNPFYLASEACDELVRCLQLVEVENSEELEEARSRAVSVQTSVDYLYESYQGKP
jgi:hypothetical protein